MSEKIVMYNSPEAATYRTDIKGWVSRYGLYCGPNEGLARYTGCTHRPCQKCGKPTKKYYTVCGECWLEAEAEKYKARERKEWDEKCPVYSDALDRFYNSWDEINNAAEENEIEVEDLRLIICEPVFASEIDPEEYYQDLLPDEKGSLPTEIEEAFGRLNEAIRACRAPLSWRPGKFAVRLEG
jgi:hypothetical protein